MPVLFTDNNAVPYTLGDVVLFVGEDTGREPSTRSSVHTINPFTGEQVTTLGSFPAQHNDIAMRPDGLLFGFELDRPAKPVVRALVEGGILCGGSSKPNQIRLLPPLTLTEDEALLLLPALDKALAAAQG